MHAALATAGALATGLALALSTGAIAQTFPSKPIRMIVISAPGGGTDLLARTFAQGISDALGQSVVIDNKPGGGGIIATETLAKAQPDGYTILMTNTSHSVLPSLHKKLPYDVLKDFAPVSLVALTHSLLLVHPAMPVKTVKDLIDLAKAQPGKLNYASGTTGASAHFGAELLKMMAGVNIVQVPYKGTAGQLTALIANEVQMTFSTMPPAMPLVQAGRLRAIAIGSPQRSPALPEVPTVAESGYPGFDIGAWNGILAPARTPPAIVNRLAAESGSP
jgi:tripartite-type tricarboxylate transporter receptor subunit TctC